MALRSRIIARVLAPVVAGWCVLLAPRAMADSTCSSDCGQTACEVGCSEDEIRDAIRKANECIGDPAWVGRTISVAAGSPACTIPVLNDAAMAARHPNSSCAGDPEAHAICFRNDHVRLVGGGATFLYAGTALCGQCAEECPPPQPALFTLKGNGNAVEDLTYRYFPEGIHIRAGNDHTVARVVADRICEDAITVDVAAGAGHVVRDSILIGNTAPDGGRTCVLATDRPGACGTDKAIQLNGGRSSIERNTIDRISQPVHVSGGEHAVIDNRTTGSADDQNLCQSYTASTGAGPATVTMRGNTILHCKFGIRVDGTALVIAEGNRVIDPWVSAFDVRGAARLMGQDNLLRTRAAGFTDRSTVQRGLVVARNGSGARIDLGGGDYAGRSVVADRPCSEGGACSHGGNRFCSGGSGVQIDIWNITDCPCLNRLCGGTLGQCTVNACAPLDDAGQCLGTAGAGASIGARGNCFRTSGRQLTEVKDAGDDDTAIGGATECSASACDF